jgi:putative transposase
MKRFTSAGHAQRFLSAFSGISPHFRPRHHLFTAEEDRHEMGTRFSTWNEVTGTATAVALSTAPETDSAAQPRFHVSTGGPKLDKLTMPC